MLQVGCRYLGLNTRIASNFKIFANLCVYLFNLFNFLNYGPDLFQGIPSCPCFTPLRFTTAGPNYNYIRRQGLRNDIYCTTIQLGIEQHSFENHLYQHSVDSNISQETISYKTKHTLVRNRLNSNRKVMLHLVSLQTQHIESCAVNSVICLYRFAGLITTKVTEKVHIREKISRF